MFFRRWYGSFVLLCSIPFLYSQTAPAPVVSNPTFKAKVQAVLVDLTVTDGNGSPIIGLNKDNFEISEDGVPQVVTSFEEHRGGQPAVPTERASLPPHTYTNAPLVDPSGSVNVLLLDTLNTLPEDQMVVRKQMIKYLTTMDPGPRLAIFTLGEKLRMVEGFTSDPRQLLAALNHKDWGGMPQTSLFQSGGSEDTLEQQALVRMADMGSGTGQNVTGAIQSLQNFLSEVQSTEKATEISVTLQVLQTLARYLSAFPGRKNLIWFSGSFPQINFPSTRERMQLKSGDIGSGGDESGLGQEIKKTINVLATAQVAVYPITAQGVEVDTLFQAKSLTPTRAGANIFQAMNDSRADEDEARYLNQNAADEIAINTGGQAIYNTNGFKEAFADAVHRGSYYYRFSYTPSNKRTEGRYRHIRVKVLKGRYKLAYRRGYFEDTEKEAQADEQEPTDPLTALMTRGMPDSTHIIYTLRVLPSNTPASTHRGIAGDNKELRGPLTRFGVDFVVPLNNLDFELAPDGVRNDHIRLSILIYDHNGRPLNWEERSLRTVLKPKMLPVVQSTGVQFHFDIDAPPGDLYMRTGIYDFGTNDAGTLEIPLTVAKSETATPFSIHETPSQEPVPASSEKPSNESSSNAQVAANESTPGSPAASISIGSNANPSKSLLEQSEPVSPTPELNSKSEIESYCKNLGDTNGQSSALTSVCNFALTMQANMPDIICDRSMKRTWWNGSLRQKDTVTARVTYRNGHDDYKNIQLDGKTVDAAFLESYGGWSDGEFANILAGVFAPSSKTNIKVEKDGSLHSKPALVFQFRVSSRDNHSFYIEANHHEIWYPEYHGSIWIDKATLQILRVERDTGEMLNRPITKVKTTIDYSEVTFGDSSKLVLPMSSDVSICSWGCSHSSSQFIGWRKFGASTNIILDTQN